ncbi:hypothetical protein HPB47_014248 [Ixodes persulcatus]|uniref:Uncharacterized protein n=1 Tax=Ixodes persulcatus TaxID=34615 RepID=A0AC60QWH6_IXOPE|nr:hypothetical protein HPB47_014248 [Ixodes persulcatus]
MTTQQDQYPKSYCTHLVYSDVVFDPKHRKFLSTKNDKSFDLFRRNQGSYNMSQLVALNPHQTLNVYLNGLTDMEVQWYFVQMTESLMSDYHFDGVAFIGIELSLENVQQFSRVIDGTGNRAACPNVADDPWSEEPPILDATRGPPRVQEDGGKPRSPTEKRLPVLAHQL